MRSSAAPTCDYASKAAPPLQCCRHNMYGAPPHSHTVYPVLTLFVCAPCQGSPSQRKPGFDAELLNPLKILSPPDLSKDQRFKIIAGRTTRKRRWLDSPGTTSSQQDLHTLSYPYVTSLSPPLAQQMLPA